MKTYLVVGVLLALLLLSVSLDFSYELKDTASKQRYILEKQEELKLSLIEQGRYKCCLEKPCSYCLEHTDKQMVCDCLEDVMEGKAPCGECLGEILEGEGNHLIKEYFSASLADELGEENKAMLDSIIEKKYSAEYKDEDEEEE